MPSDPVARAFGGWADERYAEEARRLLAAAGYAYEEQVLADNPFSDRPYHIDFLTTGRGGHAVLCELMYQGATGSAEQKVPYKALQLIDSAVALNRGAGRAPSDGAHAYLVLAGEGYQHAGDLIARVPPLLRDAAALTICTWEHFRDVLSAGAL